MHAAYSQQEIDAAISALEDPERFRAAEAIVAVAAPKLPGILAQALEDGDWSSEEALSGMLVGVAVGWALHEELTQTDDDHERTP